MLDTIHIWQSSDSLHNTDLMAETSCHINNIVEHKKEDCISLSGKINNLKISLYESGISIKGSLSKYYLGDNIQTLNRNEIKYAIENISDTLHLPIQDSNITRLDIGLNFPMKLKPEAYYPYLGDCNYYNRLKQPKSIYYRNSQRQMIFYDKVLEAKKSKMTIPKNWTNDNILRYEYRLMKGVSKRLKIDKCKVYDLYNKKTFNELVHQYIDQYSSINKIPNIQLNYNNMNSPKDVHKQILAKAYQALGSESIELVEELRLRGAFEKKEYYSRLKKEIKEHLNIPCISERSELIEEIDEKINQIKDVYCQ